MIDPSVTEPPETLEPVHVDADERQERQWTERLVLFLRVIAGFQHHYTPPELQQANPNAVSVRLDADGNPAFLQNPLLSDLDAHIRMMDCAGIDAALLSSAPGFDQPDLVTCRLINDRMKQ